MSALFLVSGADQMDYSSEQIDFVVDQKFVDSLAESGDSEILKGERFICFRPLYHLYLLFRIIVQIIDKDEYPRGTELKKLGLDDSALYHLCANFKKEIPIYRFVHHIMLNRIESVKSMIDNGTINIHSRLDNTSLFLYAAASPSISGFSYLSVAATLGRQEIFKYLIWEKTNPGKMVFISVVKPVPIPLSTNECLLMNAIYHWYKSGKKQKLKEKEVNALIDTIILASRINPYIVSDHYLLDQEIGILWYWYRLKEIVEDVELLKRLIPLNPRAMKENLRIPV